MTTLDKKYYSIQEIAKTLGWSQDKVRRTFQGEPGVLLGQLRAPSRTRPAKRQHIMLRVPESVLLRVVGRLTV